MEVSFEPNKNISIIYALLLIVIGLLFIVNPGFALSTGVAIVGIILIIAGLVPMFMNKSVDAIGVVMIVLGILLVAAPFLFATLIAIIVGIIAIIVGILAIVGALQNKGNNFVQLIIGILILVAGACTFIGEGWPWMVFGAILLVTGALALVGAFKN